MEKAELIRKRAKMELEASQTRQAALDLEEKMERLRRAKGSLHHVIADGWQQERKIGHIDAQPSFWKGETKNKYSEMMQSMASSTHRYVNGWMRAEAKIEEEIRRHSSMLSEAESHLYFLRSRITGLSEDIAKGD
ncbi:DUF5082 family protein [Heyndrickxia faecalis]|uniref:YwqH-like family protein n=1 Tax=Heyndrickxia TaxID=2837504 RepID=UPI00054DFABD|nr:MULTISPECIES: DUF5082 family protein [Heyndrickxia]NMH85603.1 DUF5082 domain-containing protein [Heyndrickxia coagulans]NWN95081.1 DUF5082 family protein [Bacillus sp. (in: firmicutes)]KGT39942.1 hypothetical protein P421_02525 [Heyndrickxia coagulans P38]MED4320743.1 DUF5082 family protein [Weizmannia sp. CD-2023]MED4839513.1 DUF5082 family protein [Weizmannia sp. CD-2023]